MKSEKWLLLGIVASMCIWGISWSSAKVLSGYGSAVSIAFIRFVIVALGFPLFLASIKVSMKIQKAGLGYLISTGILMTAYSICFFRGLQLGQPGAAGVLVTSLNPLFAYLVGIIISKSVPKKYEILGLIVGVIAGLVLLEIWSNDHGVFDAGNALFVFAALIWAIMSKITSHAGRFGNAMGFNMWIHVITVIGLTPIVDYNEVGTILQSADSKFWFNILYLSLINSIFATGCFFYATTKLGAEKASSYIFIVPGTAVIASWGIMGESILMHTIIGGLLGVLAVFIINGKVFKNNASEK